MVTKITIHLIIEANGYKDNYPFNSRKDCTAQTSPNNPDSVPQLFIYS